MDSQHRFDDAGIFCEPFLRITLFFFDKQGKIVHTQCFWWSNAILALNPYWDFKVRGLENIDPHQTYVIVANHESLSVLFFPEGTRSDTDEMNLFQNGAFKLAIKEKKPILPIRIQGTRNAIPKGNWVFNGKVVGSLTVLPPIDTTSFKIGDFTLLRDITRERLTAVNAVSAVLSDLW